MTDLDSSYPLTSLTFTDDLNAMLSGVEALNLPMNVCGGTLSGTGNVNLSGGTLAVEGTCSFEINVKVPSAAVSGVYPYTSTITGMREGNSIVRPSAWRNLRVLGRPKLTKLILPKPVAID
jgi:hypothetical protein